RDAAMYRVPYGSQRPRAPTPTSTTSSLALRASHMNHRQSHVRVAQTAHQLAHAFELEILHSIRRNCGPLVVNSPIEIGECGFVVRDFRHGRHAAVSYKNQGGAEV